MLVHPGRRNATGRIAYDFDHLKIQIQADPCIVWGRATGTAHVAYDGLGSWWPEQIEYSSPRHPGPLIYLAVSDPLFGEITTRLGLHLGDDIEERIADTLKHAPRERNMPATSHIAAAAAELACLAVVLAGLLCWSLPDPHAIVSASVARLESPEARP